MAEETVTLGSDGKTHYRWDSPSGKWAPIQGSVDAITGMLTASPEKIEELKKGSSDRLEDLGKTVRDIPAYAITASMGIPGDMQSLAGFGATPENVQKAAGKDATVTQKEPSSYAFPTTSELKGHWGDYLGRPIHEPQNPESRVLKTASEIAPTAMFGGPEGLAMKLGTRVAAPAMMDEAVRALTKDGQAEGPARMAATMAAPLLARRFIQPSGGLHNPDMAPRIKRIEDSIRGSGGELDPASKTGSPGWKALQDAVGVPKRMNEGFQKGYTGANLKAAGIPGDSVLDATGKPTVLSGHDRALGAEYDALRNKYNIPKEVHPSEYINHATDPSDQFRLKNVLGPQFAITQDLLKASANEPGKYLDPKKVMGATSDAQSGYTHTLAKDVEAVKNQADPSSVKQKLMAAALMGGAGAGAFGIPALYNQASEKYGFPGMSGTALSSGAAGVGGAVGAGTASLLAPKAAQVAALLMRKPIRGGLMNPAIEPYLTNTAMMPRAQGPASGQFWARNLGMVPGATANERSPPPEER